MSNCKNLEKEDITPWYGGVFDHPSYKYIYKLTGREVISYIYCNSRSCKDYESTEKFERLTKTVRVSDPENWYERDTVDVWLYVTSPYENKVRVRVLIMTVDDFSVGYDWECDADNKGAIESAYNHLKEYMYDRMPEEISLDWLYEHGYLVI